MINTKDIVLTIWTKNGIDKIENYIDCFISSLHYELQDNLELERINFGISTDYTDEQAIKEIENYIEKVLYEYEFGGV